MFTVVGLIGMTGIIINDSIVLVTTIDEYSKERGLFPAIVDGVTDNVTVPMGEQLIHDACAKSLTGQISVLGIKSSYKYKITFPEKFPLPENTNGTHAKLNGNYKPTHSIGMNKGA